MMIDFGACPPLSNPRRRARRAMLSALAGGGLTAAGLSGPLAGAALGADSATAASPASGEGPAAPPGDRLGSCRERLPTPASTATATDDEHPHGTQLHAGEPAGAAPSAPTPRRRPGSPDGRTCSASRRRPPARTRTAASPPTRPRSQASSRTNGADSPRAGRRPAPTTSRWRPSSVAAAGGALAAELAGSAASAQALSFYRIPAVPASDLPGRRRPVRRAMADPRGDQRNRDRLRQRPVGVHGGRRGVDAVHARAPGCNTASTR